MGKAMTVEQLAGFYSGPGRYVARLAGCCAKLVGYCESRSDLASDLEFYLERGFEFDHVSNVGPNPLIAYRAAMLRAGDNAAARDNAACIYANARSARKAAGW